MAEVATSGGPLAIALCFGAYSCCWFAVVGFLPTLQVERLGFSTSTAAVVTAAGHDRECRAATSPPAGCCGTACRGSSLIVGAPLSMAFCAAGIFVDGVPDLLRLVLAGALFGGDRRRARLRCSRPFPSMRRAPQLVGAATGLLMQGSNIGALLGPPITAALVSAGGWPAAAWLTSVGTGDRGRGRSSSCTGAKGVELCA